MTTALKILGQISPAATTLTTLYTVPASTTTVISSLFACNRGGAATTIRIAIMPSGDTASNENYIYYDLYLPANDTLSLVAGITLEDGDFIQCYTNDATVSFHAYGQENS